MKETEQLVHAVEGRILPTFSDFFWIVLFAPSLIFLVWLSVHRLFRSVTYIITTQRVLVVEPQGVVDEIQIKDIQRTRTRRRAMMIHGPSNRLWLSRLPDAWRFEAILERVRKLS